MSASWTGGQVDLKRATSRKSGGYGDSLDHADIYGRVWDSLSSIIGVGEMEKNKITSRPE